MFLKMAGFKSLIKDAWKGAGLVVGNDGEGIYLYGNYWTIYLERTMISKKSKSCNYGAYRGTAGSRSGF